MRPKFALGLVISGTGAVIHKATKTVVLLKEWLEYDDDSKKQFDETIVLPESIGQVTLDVCGEKIRQNELVRKMITEEAYCLPKNFKNLTEIQKAQFENDLKPFPGVEFYVAGFHG